MEKCYQYFLCNQKDCPCWGTDHRVKCWEVKGTKCQDQRVSAMLPPGKSKCDFCLYRREVDPLVAVPPALVFTEEGFIEQLDV